jgi:hypothetical protein
MVKLAADLKAAGMTITRDSGDPVGLNFLAECSSCRVLALYDGDALTITVLSDPQRAWPSQFDRLIRESLHCSFHRKAKALGAHA